MCSLGLLTATSRVARGTDPEVLPTIVVDDGNPRVTTPLTVIFGLVLNFVSTPFATLTAETVRVIRRLGTLTTDEILVRVGRHGETDLVIL